MVKDLFKTLEELESLYLIQNNFNFVALSRLRELQKVGRIVGCKTRGWGHHALPDALIRHTYATKGDYLLGNENRWLFGDLVQLQNVRKTKDNKIILVFSMRHLASKTNNLTLVEIPAEVLTMGTRDFAKYIRESIRKRKEYELSLKISNAPQKISNLKKQIEELERLLKNKNSTEKEGK